MPASTLAGGFADPARDAAIAFRTALDCMARPGRIGRLRGVTGPAGMSRAAAVLLLALADSDAPVWLPERLRDTQAADWLRFHADAALTEAPEAAVFALGTWAELSPLERWPAGEAAYPDRGVTLILEVDRLDGARPRDLTGPGIAGQARLAPDLPEEFDAAMQWNAARYPLGLDLFLTAGEAVAALPRTTRIGG